VKLPLNVIGLAALCVVQLAAAGWSIARYETTLASGALYKFKTVPIDPADAFRGRYVAVQPAVTIPAPVPPETARILDTVGSGAAAYVVLATDADGFARAASIVSEAPAAGDYVKVARSQMVPIGNPEAGRPIEMTYQALLPFNRYYMNETAAPAAEQRYTGAVRRNAETRTWLAVRVRNGIGVIEGLYIDGVPIEDVVRSAP
jgi:uncharacterized membrane-anchored protein